MAQTVFLGPEAGGEAAARRLCAEIIELGKRELPGAEISGDDAADALACAICHAHGGLGLGKIATAGYRMKRGRLV